MSKKMADKVDSGEPKVPGAKNPNGIKKLKKVSAVAKGQQ